MPALTESKTDDLARHWRSCYRVALAALHDPAAAEDAAQEAYLALLDLRDRGELPDDPGAWLRGTALNKAKMRVRGEGRRSKRERRVGERRWRASTRHQESLDTLADLTADLPEKLRLPIELLYGLGHTQTEVAELLGCPKGTVASRVRRGLKQLREQLGAKGDALALSAVAALVTAAYEGLKQGAPPAPQSASARPAPRSTRKTPRSTKRRRKAPPPVVPAGPRRELIAGAVAAAAAVAIGVAALLMGGDAPAPDVAQAQPSSPARPELTPQPTPARAARAAAPEPAASASPTEPAPAPSPEPTPEPEPQPEASPAGPLLAERFPLQQMHLNGGAGTLALSADGRRAATGLTQTGTLTVWDVDGQRAARELDANGERLEGYLRGLTFVDGQHLAALFGDRLRVWDAGSGALLKTLGVDAEALTLPAEPDGRSVVLLRDGAPSRLDVFTESESPAAAGVARILPDPLVPGGAAIELWEEGDWWRACTVPVAGDLSHHLDCVADPAAGWVIAWSNEVLVRVDLEAGEVVATQPVWGVRQVAAAGEQLVVCGETGLELRDAATLERVADLSQGSLVHRVAVSADGRTLVGTGPSTLRRWSLPDGDEQTPRARVLQASLQRVAPAPGGRVVAVDRGGQVSVWDPRSGALLRQVTLPGPSARFDPETEPERVADAEEFMLYANMDGAERQWICRDLVAAQDAVWVAALNAYDDRNALGLALYRVALDGGAVLEHVAWPTPRAVFGAGFSADGRRVAAVSWDDALEQARVHVYSLPGLTPVSEFPLDVAGVAPGIGRTGTRLCRTYGPQPSLSADGSRLALQLSPTEAGVFDVARGEQLARVGRGDESEAISLAYLFDYDAQLEVYAPSGEVFSEHAVVDVRLSPDGRTVLLSHPAECASGWDALSGEALWSSEAGRGVALTPDGLAVVMGELNTRPPDEVAAMFAEIEAAEPAAQEAVAAEVDRLLYQTQRVILHRLDARSGETVGAPLYSETPGACVESVVVIGGYLVGASIDARGTGGGVIRWTLPAQ